MIDIVERLEFDAARCEVGYSKGVATNITEAAAEITKLRSLIKGIVDAYDSGNLEMRSAEVGEPDVGIPMHEWHEEWLHYARGTLSHPNRADPT